MVNQLKKGDTATVSFDINGREWNGKYFVNLVAWRIQSGAKAPDTDVPPPLTRRTRSSTKSCPSRVLHTRSMATASDYDCTHCGACCCSFPIFATEADAAREPRIRRETLREPEQHHSRGRVYRLHPLPFRDRCAFLKRDKLCRIYATRPEVCRRFTAGSTQCIEARQRQGIEPTKA